MIHGCCWLRPVHVNINWHHCAKVEEILKGSMDSIPSPSLSLKIQIMGGKVCLRCKGKHCWALSTNIWKQKKVASPSNVLPYQSLYFLRRHPSPLIWRYVLNVKLTVKISSVFVAFLKNINFPTDNLNFPWTWRWCDQIQAIFLNLFYFISLNSERTDNYFDLAWNSNCFSNFGILSVNHPISHAVFL